MGRYDHLITGVSPKLPGAPKPHRKHKYHATPTAVDGIRFASKKEAKRYGELKMLEKEGHIENLTLQPRYELLPRHFGKKLRAILYVADFAYREVDTGQNIVEDVKGYETPVWRLKRNMFLRRYPDLELRVIR